MRWVGTILVVFVVYFLAAPVSALSPSVIDPTLELDADIRVLVSSLFTKRGEIFIELHNNSEQPVELDGWMVRFLTTTSEADVVLPQGWLLDDEFISLSENSLVGGVYGFSALSFPADEAITNA
jgi:hypothetical protein